MSWLSREREDFYEAYKAGHAAGVLVKPVDEAFDIWWTEVSDLHALMELDLPVRVYNALTRAGVQTIGQLRHMLDPDSFNDTVYDVKGLGVRSHDQIRERLRRWDAVTKGGSNAIE